jgi:hypothetical protein
VVPFETARRLTRALPDAHLQLVEGAGHHLPRRAPAVVADAIVAFLAAAQITDGRDRGGSAGRAESPTEWRYRWSYYEA